MPKQTQKGRTLKIGLFIFPGLDEIIDIIDDLEKLEFSLQFHGILLVESCKPEEKGTCKHRWVKKIESTLSVVVFL